MGSCGNCGQSGQVCTCYFENGCVSGIEIGEDGLTWYVALDGFDGTRVSTPDSIALSPTGDMALAAQIAAVDYTTATAQNIIAKWLATGNQRSYRLQINTSGGLSFSWTTDGSTILTRNSTVPLPLIDDQKKWVAASIDVDNGAAGHDVFFLTSDDGITYTPFGATVTTAGVTSIFNSTSDVQIGTQDNGVGATPNHFNGKIYKAQVITPGLTAAEFNPEDANGKTANTQVPTTFESHLGEDWTLGGNARWNFDPASFCAVVTGNGRTYAPINFRPNNVPLPRPYGHLLRGNTQTFSASTIQSPIIWDQEGPFTFGSTPPAPFAGGMYTTLPTDRMIIPIDGYYIIAVQNTVETPSATGNELTIIRKNGTTNIANFLGAVDGVGGFYGPRSIVVIERFVAGDFVQVLMSTPAGGNTLIVVGDLMFDWGFPYLWMQWMRPL